MSDTARFARADVQRAVQRLAVRFRLSRRVYTNDGVVARGWNDRLVPQSKSRAIHLLAVSDVRDLRRVAGAVRIRAPLLLLCGRKRCWRRRSCIFGNIRSIGFRISRNSVFTFNPRVVRSSSLKAVAT